MSESEDPAPDPIVYLEGGPGGHALEVVPFVFESRIAPFLTDRRFIVFDQRGVGYSDPNLDCPELIALTYETLDQQMSVEEHRAKGLSASLACRDRLLEEGVNLRAYTSADNAADLNALRRALGYEEWNLYGISYGTRLALTAVRDYPEGIRSVVLDSAYPLQVDLYTSLLPNADRAFGRLFEGCGGDPDCNRAYPGLESTFFELVRRLNAEPVMIAITNPLSGDTLDYLLDGDELIGFLFQSLYSEQLIPLLPKLIFDVEGGRYGQIGLILGLFVAQVGFTSDGMYFSVQCGEEVPFSSPDEIVEAADAYPRIKPLTDSHATFAICEAWGTGKADPIENLPVNSDIPTLVLAGEFDPITPPSWGRMVGDDLSSSFFFEFPGVGHGASTSGECPLSITLAFLDDPTVRPDGTCIAQMAGPVFAAAAEIKLVSFEDGKLGIKGVIPEGWIEVQQGVYAPSLLGDVAIVQTAVSGVTAAQALSALLSGFGLSEIPESAGTRNTETFTWTLYELEMLGVVVDVATAEDGAGTTYMVMMTSSESDRERYYLGVYVPAINELAPLSR